MKVNILSKNAFMGSVLPQINNLKDSFFISILDDDEKEPLREDSENYKTWWFYDLEEDINNYKAITEEQAKEIFDFIKSNSDKKELFVHCAAGISRSGAVGSFVYEYFGGAYKELLKKHPHILPNGRVTRFLRMYERMDGDDYQNIIF